MRTGIRGKDYSEPEKLGGYLKKEADAQRIIQDFEGDGIQVLNGRYGPYITDRKKNARVPKERDPRGLTLEECRALLAAAPERGGRFGRFRRGAKAAPAAESAPGTPTEAAPAGTGSMSGAIASTIAF